MNSPTPRLASSLLVLALVLAACLASAQPCPDLTDQARYLGRSGDMPVVGICSVGDDLVATTTPDSLLVIHRVQPGSAPVPVYTHPLVEANTSLSAQGDLLFVAGERGVKMFRVAGDGTAQFVGRLPGFEPAGLVDAAEGHVAVAHDDGWSLWTVDQGAVPTLLARIQEGTAPTILSVGQRWLATRGTDGQIRIWDLADASAPVLRTEGPLTNLTFGMAVVGDRLYRLAGTVDDGGSWIYGDRWYYRTYSVIVSDLTDPENLPPLAQHHLAYSTAWFLHAPIATLVRDGNTVVAGQSHDDIMLVLDGAAPANTTPRYLPMGAPEEPMAVQGDLIVGGSAGLWAWHLPPTMAPGRVPISDGGLGGGAYGSYDLLGLHDLAHDGEYVAAAAWRSWGDEHYQNWMDYVLLYRTRESLSEPVMYLYDVGNRIVVLERLLVAVGYGVRAWELTGTPSADAAIEVPITGTIRDVASLAGRMLVTGDRDGLVAVHDLTDPSTPALLSQVTVGAAVGRVVTDGPIVLVSHDRAGTIYVLDAGDPEQLRVTDSVVVPGEVRQMATFGGRGLVLSMEAGKPHLTLIAYDMPTALPDAAMIDKSTPRDTRILTTEQVPFDVGHVAAHRELFAIGGRNLHLYDSWSDNWTGSVATSHPYLGVVSQGGRLLAVSTNGLVDLTDLHCTADQQSVADAGVPAAHLQLRATPNPFNPLTQVAFNLAAEKSVSLAVYDLKGRRVRDLGAGRWTSGMHTVPWNGRDDGGRELSSGVYFVRLTAGAETAVAKVTLVR